MTSIPIAADPDGDSLAGAHCAEEMRTVSILGATGTIGRATASLIVSDPGRFRVETVVANRNAERLAAVARAVGARRAVVCDEKAFPALKAELSGSSIEADAGWDAVAAASEPPVDFVMAGIVGFAGLAPTLAAIDRGITVALANKECLVAGGCFFTDRVKAAGARLLPVDSEHNAIFQALQAGRRDDVARIILSASGGPFRTWARKDMASVTPEQALKHPKWTMGAKITIDSATMMNKGLEVIEARHLFDMPPERIDVLVHPQSVVHGIVQYVDGSLIAQMGAPDMRTPIAQTLAWPGRMPVSDVSLSFTDVLQLEFEPPDDTRFPALQIARDALYGGDWATCVLNAANEVAVAAFLSGRIGFLDICAKVGDTLEKMAGQAMTKTFHNYDAIVEVDREARRIANGLTN